MRASKSVYLYGPDTLARERRFRTLVPKGRIYYLFETSWGEILEEVRYPSLFSGGMAGIRILNPAEERVSKKDRGLVEEVISFGVVISSEYPEKSELKNLIKNLPCSVEYYRALYERERASLVREELAKAGKEISRDALIYMVKTVGDDTLALWGEITKLKHHPSRRIELEHVEQLVPPLREYPVWELEVALANRDYPKAWEVLEDLRQRGQSPQMITGSLNYMVGRICRRDLSEEFFALDWRVKMGYSAWDAIHLAVLRIMELCRP